MKAKIERSSLVFLLVFILASLGEFGLSQDIKIAVVDLDVVVAQSAAGKQLQEKLDNFEAAARAEIQAKGQQLRDIQKRGTEGATVLSEAELTQLGQDFQRVQTELAQLQEQKQKEGQEMQQEGFSAIQKLLEPVFQTVRDEGGYDIILNRTPGIVLYGSERVDITARVAELLKATENPGS